MPEPMVQRLEKRIKSLLILLQVINDDLPIQALVKNKGLTISHKVPKPRYPLIFDTFVGIYQSDLDHITLKEYHALKDQFTDIVRLYETILEAKSHRLTMNLAEGLIEIREEIYNLNLVLERLNENFEE